MIIGFCSSCTWDYFTEYFVLSRNGSICFTFHTYMISIIIMQVWLKIPYASYVWIKLWCTLLSFCAKCFYTKKFASFSNIWRDAPPSTWAQRHGQQIGNFFSICVKLFRVFFDMCQNYTKGKVAKVECLLRRCLHTSGSCPWSALQSRKWQLIGMRLN